MGSWPEHPPWGSPAAQVDWGAPSSAGPPLPSAPGSFLPFLPEVGKTRGLRQLLPTAPHFTSAKAPEPLDQRGDSLGRRCHRPILQKVRQRKPSTALGRWSWAPHWSLSHGHGSQEGKGTGVVLRSRATLALAWGVSCSYSPALPAWG